MFAQSYQSLFGKINTSWEFEYYNLGGKANESAKIDRDTLIDGTSYKIVKTNSGLEGYIREDTLSGKVWYRGQTLTGPPFHTEIWPKEFLLFDFSLQPGDSFDVNLYLDNDTNKVYSKVDSVKLINGSKYIYFNKTHPQWHLSNIIEPYVMIEGVGGNMGPLWKSRAMEANIYFQQYLLCYYKDGVQTDYRNQRYNGDCYGYTGIDKTGEGRTKPQVYPNPATSSIYVNNAVPGSGLAIFNTLGQCIVREILQNNQQHIDMSSFPTGIYLIYLTTKNGEQATFKIRKQ